MRFQHSLSALVAGAALALTMSGAAHASTIVTYEYVLEYERESFGNAFVEEARTSYVEAAGEVVTQWFSIYDSDDYPGMPLDGEDNIYGFKGPMTGVAAGTQITLSMSIDLTSPRGYPMEGLYHVDDCDLGDGRCAVKPEYWKPGNSPGGYGNPYGTQDGWMGYRAGDMNIDGIYGDADGIMVHLSHVRNLDAPTFDHTDTLRGYYDTYTAYFSLVETRLPGCDTVMANLPAGAAAPACQEMPEIYPAPLPPSALLLGGGIAGFGWLTRRRRARRG